MKQVFLIVLILFSLTMEATSNSSLDTTKIENKNIRYHFTSDANNLYLTINTKDRAMMMSMVRSGISVYFDVKGKKKKNVYVKYPINSKRPDKSSRGESDQKRLELSEIINDLPKKAEYSYFENTQQFHTALNTQDISLGFEYSKKERALEYHLKIPKEHISRDKEIDLTKLSLGITIGDKNTGRKGQRGNLQMQGPSGRGQRGSVGGGRGGSVGGRGGSGGGRSQGGGNNSQQRERPSKTTIDFWFDAISKK